VSALLQLFIGLLLAAGASCGNGEPPPGPNPDAVAAMARARKLFAGPRPFDALPELERAVELAPGWAEAHLSLGKFLLTYSKVHFASAVVDRARLEQAIMHLERACALDGNNAEAVYWAGRALAKADRGEEAERRLSRALALNPEHGLAMKELGALYASEGDSARAIELLTRARARLPKDDELLLELGLQLESEGRLEEARDALLAACKLNPAHPGPRAALAPLYGRLGDPALAERMHEEYERLRAFGKRLTDASQNYDKNGQDPAASMNLAELYLEIGMPYEASQWAKRALLLDAKYAPALEMLQRLGQPAGSSEPEQPGNGDEQALERLKYIAPEPDEGGMR
jgi:tetratricopeptide (TPR) repeat protein